MYTFESQVFSKEFENAAKKSISKKIAEVTKYDDDSFNSFLNEANHMTGSAHVSQSKFVRDLGHRWKSEEHAYQAMIMDLSDKMRKERGPGLLQKKEANSIEGMFMNNPHLFQSAAKNAVGNAAATDYYYLYEKDYG